MYKTAYYYMKTNNLKVISLDYVRIESAATIIYKRKCDTAYVRFSAISTGWLIRKKDTGCSN